MARVPTWITRLRAGTDWIAREVDVAAHLDRVGVPVVPPSAELPPGPHRRDGCTVTYARPTPDRPVDAPTCAAMLPDLHAGLATYPGALPELVDGMLDLRRWLAGVETVDALPAADVELLHGTAAALRLALGDAGASRPLHGDVHSDNLVGTADGPLWIDFEEVCRGPDEWDLATIDDPAAVSSHHRPDPALLATCRRLRQLQIALCLAQLQVPFAGVPGWEAGLQGALDALRGRAVVP